MRLLAVADLHYSLPQYDWLTSVAEEFDVVVVAGDHLDLSSMVDFRAQVVVVTDAVAAVAVVVVLAVQVVVVAGRRVPASRSSQPAKQREGVCHGQDQRPRFRYRFHGP